MNTGDRDGERWVLPGLGRRHFLIGAAAAAAAVATGCGSDGGSDANEPDQPDGADEPVSAAPTPEPPSWIDGPVFTLGVASGDPTAEAVILWTRLALDPDADDGLGGMADEDVEVVWEVATDEAFEQLVASDAVTARADHGHSIHVDATGLAAGTDHWYRFRLGDETSTVGRTRTLPDGSPDAFSLAVANCQLYETGTYAAYRHLLDEDVDLVLHLGDYIYEYAGGEGNGRNSLPNRVLETLGDYRLRYASYKQDPDLAAAHARFPFVVTWDDHEVANNYMGDTRPDGADAATVQAQKAAAYQAWWEHMPVRMDPPDGSVLPVFRDLVVGGLAQLYVLDERQHSDEPPCRNEASTGLDYGNCEAVEAEDRTRLGEDQEAWLADRLGSSTATWNLLGNPVVLAGVNAGTDDDAYYLDTWDGFPQARRRLIAQLAEVDNPVVLTGDYHAGMTLEVRAEPFDQASALVAPEFMSPPISSSLFPQDVSARTPQLLEQLNHHGYLTVEVTPEQLTATFRVLEDVTDADTTISTASTWVVAAGDPTPTRS
jgi:alkaline phosphatase D